QRLQSPLDAVARAVRARRSALHPGPSVDRGGPARAGASLRRIPHDVRRQHRWRGARGHARDPDEPPPVHGALPEPGRRQARLRQRRPRGRRIHARAAPRQPRGRLARDLCGEAQTLRGAWRRSLHHVRGVRRPPRGDDEIASPVRRARDAPLREQAGRAVTTRRRKESMMRLRRSWLGLSAALAVMFGLWAGSAPAQAPKAQWVVAIGEEGESLDPPTSMLFTSEIYQQHIFDTLVGIEGEELKPVGLLAERWETVTPTTWRFHLRKGIKFHNGKPFEAE